MAGFSGEVSIMPEYVRITFPDQRDVFVDGDKMGRTNRKFRIGRGTYVFDLGDPQDYSPASRQKTIKNTTEDEPLELPFEKA
jgi:hypothetical protein